MSDKIRAIIVDDEEPARLLLKSFLNKYTQVHVLSEAADGFSAAKEINEYKPDLVFLDIQMPKISGLELLELLDCQPLVVFTTAFDEYAIQAFEKNAIDYLLKPFSQQRFDKAMRKVLDKNTRNEKDERKIKKFIESVKEDQELLNRIAVRQGSKIHVLDMASIIYFESDGDYVKIHTHEGVFLKEMTMKYLENHLHPETFIRIHRSYLLHVNEINKLEMYEKEAYLAVLKNGERLKLSKAGYKLLREKLKL